MSKISLLEKLKIFWEVSISSFWFPIILVLLIVAGYFFIRTNPRNRKRNKKIYIGLSLFILLLLIIIYHPSLNYFFDYLMDNLFLAILFPNFAIYFAMIIIMNIIVWISIFNYRTSDIIKRVNTIIYILMNYLLALTLKVVDASKLNIFSESSIYASKKATALIELSSLVFVLWIIFLLLYKLILVYVRRDYKPKVRKVIIKKKKLPENYEPTTPPVFIQGMAGKRVTLIDDSITKQTTEDLEKMLTVEDYRLLLKILKEEKEKEQIENKEKELIELEKQQLLRQREMQLEKERIAEMKLQEKLREEEKFTELEMLYRSIK